MTDDAAAQRHRSPRLDDALAFRVHRTNRLLRTHLLRVLRDHGDGLTPEQYFLLNRLAERQPARQVDLAEPVLDDPPNVSRLLDALVRRDLARRDHDPNDRRGSVVSLTVSGQELASVLHTVVVEQRSEVFAGLTGNELDLLTGLLDRVDRNVAALLER